MASEEAAGLPRLSAPVFSFAFGLLMVGLAADGSHGVAVAAWAAALVAVVAGAVFRPAATLAVLLSVATIVLSDPPLVFVALSGLCAAGYLVCRHAVGGSAGVVLGSWPTAVRPGVYVGRTGCDRVSAAAAVVALAARWQRSRSTCWPCARS